MILVRYIATHVNFQLIPRKLTIKIFDQFSSNIQASKQHIHLRLNTLSKIMLLTQDDFDSNKHIQAWSFKLSIFITSKFIYCKEKKLKHKKVKKNTKNRTIEAFGNFLKQRDLSQYNSPNLKHALPSILEICKLRTEDTPR